ncbi:MAG: Rrf2 family transcriptional regulator [Treponema sp.]|jgi:Rrf2 family protein|nr:Rrf2 family transcriptional regulator [Treponema sp.]
MKISTRGRYGVRFMIDLAEHIGDGQVTLAAVAERQHISIRCLEQVAVILRRAGLIHSTKGALGGYSLARPAQDVHIGEILRLLEGDMLVVDPLRPGESETRMARCLRRVLYERMNEAVAEVIDNKTLASLAGTVEDAAYMYFI